MLGDEIYITGDSTLRYLNINNSTTSTGIITGISTTTSTDTSSSALTLGGTKTTVRGRQEDGKFSASLIFSYVKSKLTKTQQEKLKARISNLKYILDSCEQTEQFALKDELVKIMAIAIRQQECAACGYDKIIEKQFINKFRDNVKTNIDFKNLESFPRLIPKAIRSKIESVRNKGLFDELWVLYNNPSKEQLKSTKEKVVEKDPILFGMFSYAPDTFYFIADWIDEVCDLTLDKFVDRIKTVDPQYKLAKVKALTLNDIEIIKERAKTQHERLKNTNASTFRNIAGQEEADRKKPDKKFVDKVKDLFTKKKKK